MQISIIAPMSEAKKTFLSILILVFTSILVSILVFILAFILTPLTESALTYIKIC